MRLAKLTLTGFKSFADRTEFTFDDALTGIVGPNGCGKSNVVDAIKWVLGERSSKSLRGKEMIDVIFAGSSARKPAGMAAVALAFDNPIIAGRADQAQAAAALEAPDATEATDGSAESDPNAEPDSELTSAPTLIDRRAARRRGLPIDADEVEVERRLYRDGTSQYLINGKRARLRDIRELFLDTGIGADAYSIIEQGKVDAMLLASPIERRNIFEEAAGIARYKQRRIESQRKLEKTEQNLLLTREQLESTERRLRLVKGQAAKARVFQQLDDEYQALRLAVAFEQYDDLRQRLEGLTSRLERLEGERSVAQSDLQAAEADQQTADLAVAKINDEQRTAVAARTEAGHRIERARERKTMSERAIADAERQAQTDRERHREAAARIEQLEAQAADLREQAAALAETLSEAERRLAEAEEQRAAAAERSTTSQTALASKRAAAANIDRERTHLLASVQSDEKRAEQVREQLAKLADRAAGLEGDASALERERAAVATEHDRRKQTIADVEAKLASQDASSASLSDDRQRQASHLSDLEQSAVRLDSRRQTLDEMLTSRVGLGEAVRDVLERRDAGTGFASVIAPLAELIQTEADHASVVEAALGGSLRALVVNAIDDLPSPAERDDLAGRVTFVPIARVSAPAIGDRRALPDLSSFAGRVTPLRALVRPADTLSDPHLAERVAALLDRLLGETYAVTDIDAAMMLAGGPLAARRFVTLAGDVLERDGRVVTGPVATDDAGGVLQQRSELRQLETELATVEAALSNQRRELEQLDARAAAINEQRDQLRKTLSVEQRQAASEQTRLDRAKADAARIERERSSVATEATQVKDRLDRIESDRAELRERADKLERLHAEESAAAAELERELAAASTARDAASEQVSAARVEVGRLAEQRDSLKREISRSDLARDEADRARRNALADIERLDGRLAEHRERVTAADTEAAEAAEASKAADETLAGLRTTLDAALAEQSTAAQRVTATREASRIAERDWQSVEVTRRELEVRRENLEDRTNDDLSLDIAAEYPEYRAVIEPGDVERIDVETAQPRVDELRKEIKKLGNVNIDAIAEESTLAGKNEELAAAVQDLDTAREQLTDLIDKLNIASRERFGEVFTRIQSEFAGKDGMFRRLFGGGQAEVRLMPLIKVVETPDGPKKVETDETDLLESGIEILARPPGKQPRQISQLSGGEKTLTAVALLLSIFRSKPSCFCVLDEVDAALDDANVERLAHAITRFTDQSHFVVITHNKRTMHAMHRLYGVTMQERGVSTRVSVRFDQVGADGQVNATPSEATSRGTGVPPVEEQAGGASDGSDDNPTQAATGIQTGATDNATKPSLRDSLAAMRAAATDTADA